MNSSRSALVGAVVILLVGAAPAGAATAEDSVDLHIASGARDLAAEEIREADVTDTGKGARLIEDASEGADGAAISRRPHRAFSFGRQEIVVDAATQLRVITGLNASRERVYEILPLARPTSYSPRAGYLAPPESAWVFNVDGDFTDYVKKCDAFGNNCVNGWKRQGFWTIMVAWNQGAYQYWRMYGKMSAATLTGVDFPWARTWLEFDNNGGWGGSPNEFEFPQPDEDYHGTDGATITIGFKSGINVELGKAPLTVGGSVDNTFTGAMTIYNEYWHPVNRPEIASGGVQFCRYAGAANMTRKVATRVGLRQNKNTQLGGWYIYRGQQNKTDSCPGRS